MRALSIRQPWIWCMLNPGASEFGPKDVENRSRRSNYRGQFYLHASKTIDREGVEYLVGNGIPLPRVFTTGAIVGTAEIIDCVDSHPSWWFSGPYGYVLQNATAIEPIICRGMLGFFDPKLPGPDSEGE